MTAGFAGHFGHVCVVPKRSRMPLWEPGMRRSLLFGQRDRRTHAGGDRNRQTGGGPSCRNSEGAARGCRGPLRPCSSWPRKATPFALELVDETLELLSLALSAGVSILDIRLIVLGGGAGLGLAHWLDRLQEKVSRSSMPLSRDGLEIRPAELGDYSLFLGAVVLCLQRLE